jgi:hypothetical protein
MHGNHFAGRLTRPQCSCAITYREDAIVSRGWERWQDDKLVDAVGFEAIEIAQNVSTLDAGRPGLSGDFALCPHGLLRNVANLLGHLRLERLVGLDGSHQFLRR